MKMPGQKKPKGQKSKQTKQRRQSKQNQNRAKASYQYQQKQQHADLQQQIHSDQIPSEPESYQDGNVTNGTGYAGYGTGNGEDYRTPEQVKIQIAKRLIQKTRNGIANGKSKLTVRDDHDVPRRIENDNFFVVDQNQQKQSKKPVNLQINHSSHRQEDHQLSQQLKNEYLKTKHKLFTDLQAQFKDLQIGEQPTSYKGHTKCITAIAYDQTNIYSCSKDCSIIKWDRQTGKKDFITLGRGGQGSDDHEGPILCMDYHPVHRMLATAGEDGAIRLWDVRGGGFVGKLKGHRNTVNGIKFGFNSNNLCTVSSDRTMKQWDCAQRGIIETYYGHNAEALDIDCLNQVDFISSGNDHQNIIWKTQKQTQVIFQGHDYAIDRVRSINQQRFITGCQDGSIYLWSQKKKKPIHKHPNAHTSWITSLDRIRQSNIFASGSCDNIISVWAISAEKGSLNKIKDIKTKGIVTDLKINQKEIIGTSCDQHRLGRWITHRVRNQILVYRFGN